MSSLCALSDLSVVTRHKTDKLATKLVYDRNGAIKESGVKIARPVGTTVTLERLFHTLPVRRKEFQRNIKKEFAKMINLVNAYCLVSVKARLIKIIG